VDGPPAAWYRRQHMGSVHHVYLIPGFFGFANIGELLYFSHVRAFLPRACAAQGIEVDVRAVQTYPTSSLRRRAERLLEVVADTSGDDGPIHLVGHSSGGLDARLLVSPGVSLRGDLDAERFARRVKTVVTVSAPHYGTPVASFFASLFGQYLLKLLSLGTIYVLRFGRLPASMVFKIGAVLARMDDVLGLKNNVVDQLYSQLLGDFSPERQLAVEQFLGDVEADQALLPQLTPEGIDVFNAATSDRTGVRYGSVISYARDPGVMSTLSVGLDPYGQATHALYHGLHRIAASLPADKVPTLSERQLDTLLTIYGIIPQREANDGVVPTLSQIWGEIVHATRGDHLDVLGHFADSRCDPPHIDWLSTGSGFGRPQFEALWSDVARFIAGRRPVVGRAPSSAVSHLLHLFKRR
jgi:triacylglycerol lipase